MTRTLLTVTALLVLAVVAVKAKDDYYDILGVGKDADNREIRRAFKKLALLHHPDKSKEENAQEKFLKITKAYETLKDEDKRKRYDRFGEEDDEQQQQQQQQRRGGFQSWNYYHDDFGIYDDDPEIVTLGYHEFRRSVTDSYDLWFVNFYSPQCSHCHDLAPAWRRLARQLDRIIHVAAVNCQDDFMLCREQNINAYPTLILYKNNGQAVHFKGEKEEEEMLQFVIDHLHDTAHRLTASNLKKLASGDDDRGQDPSLPWVVLFCSENNLKCPEKNDRVLLAHMLNGLVNFGLLDCTHQTEFCEKYTNTGKRGVAYYFESGKDLSERRGRELKSVDVKDMADEILQLLPDIPTLDDERYSSLRIRLEDGAGPSWLVHFVFNDDGVSIDEKKIPALVPKIKFGRVDCFDQIDACRELNIKKPTYVTFKVGGGYEVLYGGRQDPSDVAEFARVSTKARTMTTLTADDFPDITRSGSVFIDFFAPWCPPCLNLLPEFRKAALNVGGSVTFGTVDCTVHGNVCNQFNIRSYPTTIFFNQSKPHFYHGQHSVQALTDFVMDVMRPSVIDLDYNKFNDLLEGKKEDELWLVDFYAPWCGPCMQLAPEWSKMAKLLSRLPEVKVAKVDCVAEQYLCNMNFVKSYPSLRLYPLGSRGTDRHLVYNGIRRDAFALREWALSHLPPIVSHLTPHTFRQRVVNADQPTLIDFYAPWCGPCQQFSPVFDDIALQVRDKVHVAKVDCDRFQQLCRQAQVNAYPTVKFFPGLTDEGKLVNSQNADAILKYVNEQLEKRDKKKVEHDEL